VEMIKCPYEPGKMHPADLTRCPSLGLPLQARAEPPPSEDETTGSINTRLDTDDPFAVTVVIQVEKSDRLVTIEDGGEVLLGRDPSSPVADICNDNVSRRHAILHSSGGIVTVTDERSTNGTFVNGQRLAAKEKRPLNAGDCIQLAASPPMFLRVIAK
jgi:pSer/pThr/pTyr-binding forkhead associated (FHA) protein